MTDERTRERIRARRHRSPSFYERALIASDRDLVDEARDLEGIDEEVALLRLQIRRLLEEQPEEPAALQSGIRLLVQALSARHRLSGREAANVTDAIASVLEQFAAMLAIPTGYEDGRSDVPTGEPRHD
jgi:hypothetical protein